jgi:hypothetical protein
MFRRIYPQPHTGPRLRARDVKNWFGVKGDETRLVRCKFCGFICDPDRDSEARDGSFVGKGISYGSQQTSTLTLNKGRTTETIQYYEPEMVGGCPNCGSFLYRGGK